MDGSLAFVLLDNLKEPFVFVDTGHVVRYMNKAAREQFAESGGDELVGRSIMDCHNEASCRQIEEILREMEAGLDERLITDNETHRAYMRAVRNGEGRLIGYYERYEPPLGS